jgi:hypothetical protein
VSDPLVTYLEGQKAGAALAIDLLKAMKARHDDGTQVIVLVDIFFCSTNPAALSTIGSIVAWTTNV